MQTPIQQARTNIEKRIAELNDNINAYSIVYELRRQLDYLTALLPTEREVIEEAWDAGKADGLSMAYNNKMEHFKSKHYFTTKFNTNDTAKS